MISVKSNTESGRTVYLEIDDGFIVIDDSFTKKTDDEITNVGRFYDQTDGEYIRGQNLVHTFSTDD